MSGDETYYPPEPEILRVNGKEIPLSHEQALAFLAVTTERDYQRAMAEKAHGDPSNDGTKPLESFALYMDDYIHELKVQLSRTWGPEAYRDALHTVRKITTIGVAAMEVHGAPPRLVATKHARGTDLT